MMDETDKKQSIGERLLKLRNQFQLTQEELAEQLMVSRQSISKWELNKAFPDVDKLIQLSALYGCTIDYLVKGEKLFQEPVSAPIKEMGDAQESAQQLFKDSEQIRNAERVVKRWILGVCMLFSFVLCICMLVWAGRLLTRYAFNIEGKEQDIVSVDRIYEQYTKAEISTINTDGNFTKETVWLDIPGVREDDHIFYYFDEEKPDSITFEYYVRTLILPIIAGIIFLIFSLVFWMEWREKKMKNEKWNVKSQKE